MKKKQLSPWEILEEFIYESFPIFRLRRSRRRHPESGYEHDFLLMDGLDWVNVIAITPDKQVVLERQFRHGSDAVTIETPGGVIEPGEEPAAGALRELAEETGYRSDKLTPLGAVHPNPAMQSMRCHFFLAEDAVPTGNLNLDPGEDIEVFTVPLPELFEMVKRGEITHALVVAAVGLLAMSSPPPTDQSQLFRTDVP